MKDYIKEICQKCYDQLPNNIDNFFLHCTFYQGVVGPSLYYKKIGLFAKLMYLPLSNECSILLYEFWANGFDEGKKEKWEVACINYKNGSFNIDLTYPNQISEEERNDPRSREKYIEKYFGKIKVEYPKFG